ncbi:MAG: M1 family aminopeptidase/hydrolase, partial [Polyangiaceae bacterium]|nr:M1 family aminopeptidase/hydrolase [Polyangiaceae bacterium]
MLVHDPHSFADTRQGRIRHIDFELDVDFDSKQLRGTGHYTLEAPVAGSLFLDVRGIGIERVCAGESDLAWSFDQEDRVKGQRLHILNPQGLSRVTIQFVTSPGAIALGWLAPELTAGGKHPFLLSQCQAIHARSMIPCQDTPSVRFTYSATVRVPAPLTAAMSAGHTGVHQQGDVNVCTFEMPQAIPSYLFALAVGNLAFQKLGSCCGVFAEPEVLQQAAWEFAETEKLIHEAEKLFGPYLWETFNMLILPPSFPYGGMENPRLAFLTPTLITGDRSMVHVVAHELAHSWTGNLVTNATWEDFWLNEGWTVYAERRILEVLEGAAYAQLHAAVRR